MNRIVNNPDYVVEDMLKGYDLYVSTGMGDQQAEIISSEMQTVSIIVAVIVVIVLIITRLSSIMEQRDRIVAESRQLSIQEETLKARLDALQMSNGAGSDTTKVENVARSQLDMVYPGEIIFRISGE